MPTRSNEEWLKALTEKLGEAHLEAWEDLREYLFRAVLVYLSSRRSELTGWSRQAVRSLAEDFAQEALNDIREGLGQFRGESKFTTWAYRFVTNRAASELRRLRYHDLSLDRLGEEDPAMFRDILADREAMRRVGPERMAERHYYVNLLQEIIETELNDRQRDAIIAVHLRGYSMDQVAEALGLSRNSLYKLLHDARKRLRARLLSEHLAEGDILAAFED